MKTAKDNVVVEVAEQSKDLESVFGNDVAEGCERGKVLAVGSEVDYLEVGDTVVFVGSRAIQVKKHPDIYIVKEDSVFVEDK